MNNGQLELVGNNLLPSGDLKKTITNEKNYWDIMQQIRKVLLNSLYGAILNESCRFYDKRIGQSVTLTGRKIVIHMNSRINELFTGDYNHEGDTIIMADTDSCGFSPYKFITDNELEFEWTKDNFVEVCNNVANEVNDSFPPFMNQQFNVGEERGAIIRAGREICGSAGMFLAKKRYAIAYYDKEGFRTDSPTNPLGDLKIMGLDIKRSDTPEEVQDFLQTILTMVLAKKPKDEVIQHITEFRDRFRKLEDWKKGKPIAVNNLSHFDDLRKKNGKVNMPGHVRGALNWNMLRDLNKDNSSMKILDGQKVFVCKLRKNLYNVDNICYPVDQLMLPDWFKKLPFDGESMLKTVIDKKLNNLLRVLNWDLTEADNSTSFNQLFSFGE